MDTRKCINDISAPSSTNIRTSPEMNAEMVTLSLSLHSSIWCSKAYSVGMLWRMPMLIFSIFWRTATHPPSEELPRTHYVSTFLHSHYWGRKRSGSMPTRKLCPPGRSAPMHFSPGSFRWARPMPSGTRSRVFNSSHMKPLSRSGSDCRIISPHAHTME
jgi:hypothetical protein